MSEFKEQSFGRQEKTLEKVDLSVLYQSIDILSLAGGTEIQKMTEEEKLQLAIKEEKDKLALAQREIENQRNELVSTMNGLKQSIQLFEEHKLQIKQELERDMSKLILMISENVIGCELTMNKEIVEQCIKKVIEESDLSEKRTLRLNKDDYVYLESNQSEILKEIQELPQFYLHQDEGLPRGACQLDSVSYCMDSGVNKKIEYIWSEVSAKILGETYHSKGNVNSSEEKQLETSVQDDRETEE